MFLIVPIFAAIGNVGCYWLSRRYGWHGRTMLVGCLFVSAIVPAYALIGFASKEIGVRQGWELLIVAAIYGMTIGPIQAFARSTFGTLIPAGSEAAFYSAYELTNRGTSALGPLVLTVIQQATGELRYGFIFVLVNIVVPTVLLIFVDLKRGKKEAMEYHNRAPAGK